MHVHQVQLNETDILKKILAIHNEMPLAWNPSHRCLPEFTDGLFEKVQTSKEPTGFWVLTESETITPDSILGILWAVVKKDYDGTLTCGINSLWIRPDLRSKNLTALLTQPCLAWAKENKAEKLDCSTHTQNRRMREILEKQGFTPGMLQYSLPLT